MKEKKTQPEEKAGIKMPLGMKIVLLTVLMVFVAKMGIAAEREGVIVNKRQVRDLGGDTGNVYIYVDTDGNRTPDHVIWYSADELLSPIGGLMDSLLERGVAITFEDEGSRNGTQIGGYPTVGRNNLLTIDCIPMTEWFTGPYLKSWFPHAVRKAEREL